MAQRRSIVRQSQTPAKAATPKESKTLRANTVCCARCWKPLASTKAEFTELYLEGTVDVGKWQGGKRSFSALCADKNCAPYDAASFQEAREHSKSLLVDSWGFFTFLKEGKPALAERDGVKAKPSNPTPKAKPSNPAAKASMQAAKAASRKEDSKALAAKAAELEAVEQSKGLVEEPQEEQSKGLIEEFEQFAKDWDLDTSSVAAVKAEMDELRKELDSLKAENAKLKLAIDILLK